MIRRVQPIVFLIFLLAGCNTAFMPDPQSVAALPTANPDNVIFITATPQPTATAPPTSTPSPTLEPTATVEPVILLDYADRLLLNGFYEEAAQAFDDILQANTDPAIKADAAFKMGQSAVREGLYSQGIEALNYFIQTFPLESRIGQAHFLRGDAYLGLAEWNSAIQDFETYLTLRPGFLDSYANERIGDAELALGDVDTALGFYQTALETDRALLPELVLRERVAQILLDRGDVAGAVAQYDAILAVAQNAGYRAQMDYLAAEAIVNQGDRETGLLRMRRIVNNYPETSAAYQAIQVLSENENEVDSFVLGQVAFNIGEYQAAIDAFNDYTSTHVIDAIPAELYLMLGRAYREIGNSPAALIAFQTIINQYPQDPAFGEALLEQGRTSFLAGEVPEAISTYLNIAQNYDYLAETAAEALWRAGYLYGTNEEPTLSREVFMRLAEEFPDDPLASDGLLLAASAAVNAQEWDVAENLFGRIANLADGEEQAAAYYWMGRFARDRGDTAAMSQALALAIQAAPDSYFAARAADLQNGSEPFEPPAQYQFEFDEAQERAEAEQWLRDTFDIQTEGDLGELSPALVNNPHMILGTELWGVSAYDEAIEEFTEILDRARAEQDVVTSYQMARFLKDIGAFLSSQVAAADIIIAANVGTLEAPAYIARMRFPANYIELVWDVSQRRGIDPLLMLSLIRTESLFNTNATAAAGEKGLMQVIPSTAQYIAEELDWPNYQHSILFRPYAGIEFGAFYLDEQLERFSGNAVAALSGYNAGPGRAIDWLALSGGDPDLFMTTITIASTRTYVERIYSQHRIYRELYGAS